jgi:hypothetical protein
MNCLHQASLERENQKPQFGESERADRHCEGAGERGDAGGGTVILLL